MWCDTHSAKETEQQKEQWGLGLEVMGKWGEGGQNLKKRGEEVLHKIVGLAPLCQLCEETLKIFHPPIIKPTLAPPPPPPIPGLPHISSKNFPSPHYSHFGICIDIKTNICIDMFVVNFFFFFLRFQNHF